jgi:hypothetical protein
MWVPAVRFSRIRVSRSIEGCSNRRYRLRRRSGSPILRNSFEVSQDFKELRLEFLAYFVDLVDQQDTRFLAQKRPQQWSFLEELKRMEVAAQGRPFRT